MQVMYRCRIPASRGLVLISCISSATSLSAYLYYSNTGWASDGVMSIGTCNISQDFYLFFKDGISLRKYPRPFPTISKPISSRLFPIQGMFASCTPRTRALPAIAKFASTMMAGRT